MGLRGRHHVDEQVGQCCAGRLPAASVNQPALLPRKVGWVVPFPSSPRERKGLSENERQLVRPGGIWGQAGPAARLFRSVWLWLVLCG